MCRTVVCRIQSSKSQWKQRKSNGNTTNKSNKLCRYQTRAFFCIGKRMISTKRGMDDWKPLGYGNPMSNDPTLVYVPPVLDPVHYGIHTLEPMWPIRSLNRLQTGNHNGKLRPTLLTPPEGAGHFQK